VLLDRGRRSLALKDFNICRDRDRLNVFKVLIPGALRPGQEMFDCPVVGGSCVIIALRIGTVKNSKNFLRVDGPARVMMAGVAKESAETTASSESDIALKCCTKGSPFCQS
jgi:hypothetical protein